MSGLVLLGILVGVLLIGAGLWLGWQLLRQNGRMLLRLDELEKRLDELEFGEPDETERGSPEPQHLPAADSGQTFTEASPSDSAPAAGEDTRAPVEASDSRTKRFNN